MKTIAMVLLLVVLINVLAAGGFVGWLAQSGRLSQGRVDQVVSMFQKTVAEERAEDTKAAELEKQTQEKAQAAARLASVADGPSTFEDLLQKQDQASQIAMQRAERLKRDSADLRQQIATARDQITQQKQALDAERTAFEKRVKQRTDQLTDEDFQQAVGMYEQLDSGQAKQMFQALLEQGELDRVVDYLAAMQPRKAGAVLAEFQGPAEIAQATALVEALRVRNANPLAPPGSTPAPGSAPGSAPASAAGNGDTPSMETANAS